ncbi:MAG: murein biosynthesis integral membrane protein MurJ [Alphaproteobacteria bacterium]|nr:murein biosynthesis integral membrane protein MurJ [Alphaproteobacteria bacterium]
MKLFKAMATVAGLTGLSRIAGFIRDILTAAILGAEPVADAFFVALKLPNFFRRVTAEGAFSVSFVPVYSEILEKDGRSSADSFASNAFMVMLTLVMGFTLVMLFAMPFVIYVIAPGFVGDALRYDLAVELSRITFPYLLLMSLTALLGAVLNALGRFAPFAFAPVLFNFTLIIALLLSDLAQTAGHALSCGVLAAGVIQFIWLLFNAKRSGVHLRLRRPQFTGNIKTVFKLMIPGVIGAGVMHINLFADMIIASFLGAGAISYLYYADRLNQLPLGVVGIAVGTALLPMLSKAMVKGDDLEARDLFNRALEICLLLALPAAVALAVIPHQLITVLFERGAFTPEDTKVTAFVLRCYALGLPAYIAVKVFSTAHWARQDTVTPVKIAVVATIANIVMSLIFIWYIGVAGVALATGIAGWIQFIMHLQVLKACGASRFDDRFKRVFPRIAFSTCVMAVSLYVSANILDSWIYDGLMKKIFAIVFLVGGGIVVYGGSVLVTGAIKLGDVKKYFLKG